MVTEIRTVETVEGPEGVEWTLIFATFWTEKMGLVLLGMTDTLKRQLYIVREIRTSETGT